MKFADQFPADGFTCRALHLLIAHHGLDEAGFAALCWPGPQQHSIHATASRRLGRLVRLGLVRSRFEPPCWKPGQVPPQKRYYATDLGFSAHDFHTRRRYSQASPRSPADRAG